MKIRSIIFFITAIFLSFNLSTHVLSADSKNWNEQFVFTYFDGLSPEKASSQIDYLESNYKRVMQELSVEELPTVTVHHYTKYETLYLAQERLLGERYDGSGGFVWWIPENGPEIHQMFDERFEGNRQHTRSLLHEFAHIVSTVANPSISNNPRWLWETAAIYLARQYRTNLPEIDYIIAGDYPTLNELNVGYNDANEARNIYQFGFVIGEFIVHEWGIEGLIALIKSNGNISDSLGISESEFDSGWHSFMEDRYL